MVMIRALIEEASELGAGREAARALKDKAIDGLSFGYRVREARGAAPRELLALEVVEVSVVTHPMQPLARVIAVEG
jgi:phage head maturation protease